MSLAASIPCFLVNTSDTRSVSLEIWYNNLKVAAYAAARVRCTRPCADAQGFGNIEPCKTAAGAVLLRPFRGIDTVLLREHGRDAKCELGNMVS